MTTLRANSSKVRCVWPAAATLGEGPIWISDERALYWVDILEGDVFRYAPDSGKRERCRMPSPVSCVVPCTDGAMLCTASREILRVDFAHGNVRRACELADDISDIRINDGCCDADGSFWFGTMDLAESRPTGAFHRLAPDGICTRVAGPFAITNGPAFGPDGKVYLVDTLGRRILRARVATTLQLEEFVRIPNAHGYPDGIVFDAEGGLWCAHWGAGRVTRFDADGRASLVVELPVSNATKCAFGGERLDRLFVTTARKGLDPAALAREPLAGGLFEIEVDCRGSPTDRFHGGDGISVPLQHECTFATE